jgi:hypothetical protein
VIESLFLRSRGGNSKRFRIDIHAGHAAIASHKPAGDQSHVAHTTCEIQHVHATRNSRIVEKTVREWVDDGRLQRQTPALRVRVDHDVSAGRTRGAIGHLRIITTALALENAERPSEN